jgi:hypothetical protein
MTNVKNITILLLVWDGESCPLQASHVTSHPTPNKWFSKCQFYVKSSIRLTVQYKKVYEKCVCFNNFLRPRRTSYLLQINLSPWWNLMSMLNIWKVWKFCQVFVERHVKCVIFFFQVKIKNKIFRSRLENSQWKHLNPVHVQRVRGALNLAYALVISKAVITHHSKKPSWYQVRS